MKHIGVELIGIMYSYMVQLLYIMPFNSDTTFGGLVGKQNTIHIIGFFIFRKDYVRYFCSFGKVKRDKCWRWG